MILLTLFIVGLVYVKGLWWYGYLGLTVAQVIGLVGEVRKGRQTYELLRAKAMAMSDMMEDAGREDGDDRPYRRFRESGN